MPIFLAVKAATEKVNAKVMFRISQNGGKFLSIKA